MLDPAILAGIIAAAGAAAGGISTAASNANTGNKARIQALQEAQRYGKLTTEGQAAADAGYSQAARGMTAVSDRAASDAAKMGGTSGADIAALNAGSQVAAADLARKAGDTFREQQQKESDELVGRKEVRRGRTMQAVSAVTGGAIKGMQAAATLKGYTDDKKVSAPPDFDKVAGSDAVKETMKANYAAEIAEAQKQAFPAQAIAKIDQKYQTLLSGALNDTPVYGANSTTGATQ
jgi:hypothetical protein